MRRLKVGTSKMFIRERQILQQLPPHPNIVKLIEVISQPLKESVIVTPPPPPPDSGSQVARQLPAS